MLADSIISRHFREKVGNPRLILTLYDWDFFYFILTHMLNSYFSTGKFNNELFDELYCDLEYFLYNERNRLTFGDIGMFEYVIQYRVNERKFLVQEEEYQSNRQTSSIDNVQKILDNVITALRLQHTGAIGYSYIDCKDTLKIPVQVGESLSRGPFKSYGNANFWLDMADIANVQRLYRRLKDT